MGDGHTLIVIGFLGVKRAYLDIPREEAIRRWIRAENWAPPVPPDMIREFSFLDEFGVYDAYPNDEHGCENCARFPAAPEQDRHGATCHKCGRRVVLGGFTIR